VFDAFFQLPAETSRTAHLVELWPNLGDGGLREAAYRGG
jgi:hypothetical protein